MTTIVKIQASLSTSADARQMLIYNRSKTKVFEGPLTDQVAKLLSGRDKVYAKATVKTDSLGSNFIIHGLVGQQPW
jgi:hypothetical protein